MDITFDEIKEFLAEIVLWFNEVAPTVWNIMLKKTYADAASFGLGGLVCLGGAILLFRAGRGMEKADKYSPFEILYAFAICALIAAPILLIVSANMLIAVEYHTLINLFNIVK